jgi:hypothetical protein
LLSPRGMQYADALPALIKDNIGDAPLTVCSFSVVDLELLNFGLGLDFYIAKNDPDGRTIALSQVDLEVVG